MRPARCSQGPRPAPTSSTAASASGARIAIRGFTTACARSIFPSAKRSRGGDMRGKVVLRRVGIGVGVVLALAVLLGAGALLALRTRWGGGLVRDLAVPRVNLAIAGKLQVGGFRFFGRSVELTGVTLRDPEGHKVAEVPRLFVAVSPMALLRNHVELRELRLDRPLVVLQQDRRGLNLARAI